MFAIPVFLSKPGLSLLVSETDLALMLALAAPGTPPRLTPCHASQVLLICWETSWSPLNSLIICLSSMHSGSSYKVMTVYGF